MPEIPGNVITKLPGYLNNVILIHLFNWNQEMTSSRTCYGLLIILCQHNSPIPIVRIAIVRHLLHITRHKITYADMIAEQGIG